jgi:hypothetical protein
MYDYNQILVYSQGEMLKEYDKGRMRYEVWGVEVFDIHYHTLQFGAVCNWNIRLHVLDL